MAAQLWLEHLTSQHLKVRCFLYISLTSFVQHLTIWCWGWWQGMLLDESVEVTGVHHPILGPFPQMTVVPNFTFLLSNQEEISSQSVPQWHIASYHHQISIKCSIHCSFNSIASTRSHHLSLVPPQSIINSRRYSFFCQHWNTILEDFTGTESGCRVAIIFFLVNYRFKKTC